MHEFFSKLYEIPRVSNVRALCAGSLPLELTVLNLVVNLIIIILAPRCWLCMRF
jgi:hypothetical protein